jgi:hypothetical protein
VTAQIERDHLTVGGRQQFNPARGTHVDVETRWKPWTRTIGDPFQGLRSES